MLAACSCRRLSYGERTVDTIEAGGFKHYKIFLRKSLSLAAAIFLSGAVVTSANASTWQLHATEIDDKLNVYINTVLKFTCLFGQTCTFDLTPQMNTGRNVIAIQVVNSSAGYTYGYTLMKDNLTYASEFCGIFNSIGCNSSDLNIGVVYARTWVVTK